jgi:hypothetical protein
MEFSNFLNVITTVTVIGGLLFAIFEVQHMRARRRRDAALALVRSYQTPRFSKAIVTALMLPDGLSRQEIEGRLKDDVEGVWLLMTTWESLGILVFRREVALDLVEDFFSGPIALSWSRFEALVQEIRRQLGRETYFEWFQWLAARVVEREATGPPVPAHIEHGLWKP